MVVISLDSSSCGVCLFDPRTGGCIGTLPDRPRIVPFEVRLSRCCLYGDGQRTSAGIIQVVLPHGGKSGEGAGRSKAKSRAERAGGVRAGWCGRQSGMAVSLRHCGAEARAARDASGLRESRAGKLVLPIWGRKGNSVACLDRRALAAEKAGCRGWSARPRGRAGPRA